MPPVKNPCVMTSYGGIIRIRLKGRSSVTSSQPASQAPLYLFHFLVYTEFCKKQVAIQYFPLILSIQIRDHRMPLFCVRARLFLPLSKQQLTSTIHMHDNKYIRIATYISARSIL